MIHSERVAQSLGHVARPGTGAAAPNRDYDYNRYPYDYNYSYNKAITKTVLINSQVPASSGAGYLLEMR
jgi:hypothetical protein